MAHLDDSDYVLGVPIKAEERTKKLIQGWDKSPPPSMHELVWFRCRDYWYPARVFKSTYFFGMRSVWAISDSYDLVIKNMEDRWHDVEYAMVVTGPALLPPFKYNNKHGRFHVVRNEAHVRRQYIPYLYGRKTKEHQLITNQVRKKGVCCCCECGKQTTMICKACILPPAKVCLVGERGCLKKHWDKMFFQYHERKKIFKLTKAEMDEYPYQHLSFY